MTVWGTSDGPGTSTVISEYDPQNIRTYNSSQMASVNASGLPQMNSDKPSVPTLADTTSSGYNALVKSEITRVKALLDIDGQWATIWHEPYDQVKSGVYTIAQWIAALLNWKNDVLDVVNASRTHRIKFTAILQGFLSTTILKQYFTAQLIAACDAVGVDCYALGQITQFASLASGWGVPWVIGELGEASAAGSPSSDNDTTVLAFMQNAKGIMDGLANPALVVDWFDSGNSSLAGLTNSQAYWKTVCESTMGGGGGTTSGTITEIVSAIAGLPTAGNAASITIPSGPTVKAGDWMIVWATSQATGAITWTADNSFLPLGAGVRNVTGISTAVWGRQLTAGDLGGTINIGSSSSSHPFGTGYVVLRGNSISLDTIDFSDNGGGTTTATVIGPSIALAKSHEFVLTIATIQTNVARTWTPPAGYTEAAHGGNGSIGAGAIETAAFYLADAGTATSTGTETCAATGPVDRWIGVTLAFNAATTGVPIHGTADFTGNGYLYTSGGVAVIESTLALEGLGRFRASQQSQGDVSGTVAFSGTGLFGVASTTTDIPPVGSYTPTIAAYTYLAVDLRTNQILAELPLTEVKFSLMLNGAGTFNSKLKLSDPRVQAIDPIANTEPGRTAIYVERDGVLVWGGIIWTRRYSSLDDTMMVGGNEFWSYFRRRLITDPIIYSGADQLTVAQGLVSWAQSKPGGDIGVLVGAETSGVPVDFTAYSTDLKNVGQEIETLSTADGGFDFAIDVYYDQNRVPTKALRLGYPRLGRNAQQTGITAEHPGNVIKIGWDEDGTNLANSVYVQSSGGYIDSLASVVKDPAGIDAGYPLLDATVSYSGTGDQASLDALARAEAAAMKDVLTSPQFYIRGDQDPVFGSYTVGDDIRLRLTAPRWPNGLDTIKRITQITVIPQDAGQNQHEMVELALDEAI